MLVADLLHFLDLPEDTPAAARRLAEHLGKIVRAATAGDAGAGWTTVLPCPRRPGHRACAGRMVVQRPDLVAPIQWRCSSCDDQGVISNWENSPFDPRRRQLTITGAVRQVVLADVVAESLRDLRLLDPDGERLVFATRAHGEGAALLADHEELAHLIGLLAAEANHAPDRRRQWRLDTALDALTAVVPTPHGH